MGKPTLANKKCGRAYFHLFMFISTTLMPLVNRRNYIDLLGSPSIYAGQYQQWIKDRFAAIGSVPNSVKKLSHCANRLIRLTAPQKIRLTTFEGVLYLTFFQLNNFYGKKFFAASF